MTPYEIPLSPEPQRFNIDLGGTTYRMRVMWCKEAQYWTLDIYDTAGAEIVLGVPMITGLDLLRQFPHLGIAGALIVQTDFDSHAVPTFDNLGITGRLYFVLP